MRKRQICKTNIDNSNVALAFVMVVVVVLVAVISKQRQQQQKQRRKTTQHDCVLVSGLVLPTWRIMGLSK